jgi:hypothetical protein
MAKTPKIRLIRDKLREIVEEIERQRQTLADLEKQASDLEIAERVLISLGDDDDEEAEPKSSGTVIHSGAFSIDIGVPLTKRVVQKPADTPTVPEMIIQALKNARSHGKRGLEPREMTEFIAEKWWPKCPQNAVGPIAWRMYKRHELLKRESRYFLPKNDEDGEIRTAAASS